MKRFLETLDRDLFALSGCLAFVATGVAVFGQYPAGKLGNAPKSGSTAEAVVLYAIAVFVCGAGFIVRGVKDGKNKK